MNQDRIKETFQRLIAEGIEGFTLDLEGDEYKPTKGYAVAYRSCDSIEDAIANVGKHQYIGWWIVPETKETFIEIVDIFDSNLQAFVNAIMRKEQAMYDFKSDTVIDLAGFSDNAYNSK